MLGVRPELSDLESWARLPRARFELPELVARLVMATVDSLVRFDFPSGRGVGRPGVDGRIETSVGTAFVPLGMSIWEVSGQEDPRGAANENYEKRTAKPPPGIDPARTTFVFVTPRNFQLHDDWEQEKRAEGVWADVRVHDQDDLANWITGAASVNAWLSDKLGKPSRAHALEVIWREWSEATSPPTSESLVLAGREQAESRLRDWLHEPASCMAVRCADLQLAAGFCYAALRRLTPEASTPSLNHQVSVSDRWLARSVVVRDDETLRLLSLERTRMLIVALECRSEIALAVAGSGHHVALATSRPIHGGIELGPVDPRRVWAALEVMGLGSDEAERLVRDSRGRLPVLGTDLVTVRRALVRGGILDELPLELVPLLLVGAWTDSPSDIEIVTRILGDSDAKLREILRRHAGELGGALVFDGECWRWSSRLDAWQRGAARLCPDDRTRFTEVLRKVLGSTERSEFAPSRELCRGLLESIAYLGVYTDSAIAERLVGQLLGPSMVEYRASLASSLQLLAEAAPRVFAKAIRRLLTHEPEAVRAWLGDAQASWQHESSDLVIALEVLAWAPEQLSDASDLLLELAVLEGEPHAEGRAIRGLGRVFSWQYPQTVADLGARIGVLDSLLRKHPDTGFELLISLLRDRQEASQPRLPQYRDWANARRNDDPDIVAAWEAIWERVLTAATSEPRRWPALIPSLEHLSVSRRSQLINRLVGLDASRLNDRERARVRDALRSILRLYAFVPSRRKLSIEEAAQLRNLYERIVPHDPREAHAWLFDTYPKLLDEGLDDWQQLRDARAQAAAQLAAAIDARALVEFAGRVEQPEALGRALGSLPPSSPVFAELIAVEFSGQDMPHQQLLRSGLSDGLLETQGRDFVVELLQASPPDAFADLALALPRRAATWDLVESRGEDSARRYWRSVGVDFVPDDADWTRTLCALVKHGRPWNAVRLCDFACHLQAPLDPELVISILHEAHRMIATTREDVQGLYKVLPWLRLAGPKWRPALLDLEWGFLRMFDTDHPPETLYDELGNNPEYFATVAGWIATGEGEQASEAWWLLHFWPRLPGARADGSVDVDALHTWVDRARARLHSEGRLAAGDVQLGQVLANAPVGVDGLWPHESVREVLEGLAPNDDIEAGFVERRRHPREASWFTGGEQERRHAEQYLEDARVMQSRWPTVARILDDLAESHAALARPYDAIQLDFASRQRDLGIEARIEAILDSLQSVGKYTFHTVELVERGRTTVSEVDAALAHLQAAARVAHVEDDFYIIVPLEYRKRKCLPPEWYIDGWMRHVGEEHYYVSLLTAAALHGAAHQQPQVFQVIVSRPRAPVIVGPARIEFFVDVSTDPASIQDLNTPTGTMAVARPERAALDLVAFVSACGGSDAVATVLEELSETIDSDRLIEIASHYPAAAIRGAPELFDRADRSDLGDGLRGQVSYAVASSRELTAVAHEP
jgi:hypothetical protein